MKNLIVLVACSFLVACQTGPPIKIPVPVRCDKDPGAAPEYVDTDEKLRAAPGLFERVKLLLGGREQRQQRIKELEASTAGCKDLKPQ